MVDAREVAQGPAGRNSGFMIDLPHNLASGEYSPGDAAQSRLEIAHNRFAIAFAAAAAAEYGMARSTFDPCGKINAAATARGEKLNADFARSLARMGEPFETLDAAAMREMTGTPYYVGGLHTPGAVMIQPATYIRTFAAALQPVAGDLRELAGGGPQAGGPASGRRGRRAAPSRPRRSSWPSMAMSRTSAISAAG